MSTNKRILIIDDEADIREVAQIALEEAVSWATLPAGSGAEGLAKAAAEAPDAILLDVMMPDMDGFQVLEQVKADGRTAEIPVILLTAKVQAARGPTSAKAAGVILKPFDPLTLGAEIARMLKWPEPALAREA